MSYKHIKWHKIFGEDGSPYMIRAWIGKLRLHVFYRGDTDQDPHDHPWGFWTFPLTSYVEEVYDPESSSKCYRDVVKAFRLHYRPATYLHRVIGRGTEPWHEKPGKVITLVWRESWKRDWGFMKYRAGKVCWQFWKDYINGGRNAPCNDEPGDL